MKKTMDYILADPAGNTTILVLTETARKDYAAAAKQLLAACPQAEQVGFVHDGYMEMCGLEFCGNASRSYAALLALEQDPPLEKLTVQVSGCEGPLTAEVAIEDPAQRRGQAFIEMPLPNMIEEVRVPLKGRLVHMDGISHLVIPGIKPGSIEAAGRDTLEKLFVYVRNQIQKRADKSFEAFGLMLLEEDQQTLTPIVYVRDVDTIYFEGSCGSGSAATACALAVQEAAPAGDAGTYTLLQPAGSLQVTVTTEQGRITGLRMGGDVSLSQVQQADVELEES